MRPTPSYLLLMHSQLGHVPPDDDGEAGELFIPRQQRAGLTAEADDPSQTAVPKCRACSVQMAVRMAMPPARLMFEDCTWRFITVAAQ